MKPTPLNLVDVSCNLCGYHNATVLFPATDKQIGEADTFSCTSPGHGEYYSVVRCKRCGLRFSSPRPTAEAFGEPVKFLTLARALGVFLHLAKLIGWHVNGIEPSSWSTQRASELYGLQVNVGGYI